MFVDSMYQLGSKRSCIRELFEYGQQKARELGPEHVFDYSLGNPSVPVPAEAGKVIGAVGNRGYARSCTAIPPLSALWTPRVPPLLMISAGAALRRRAPEKSARRRTARPRVIDVFALAIPGAENSLLTFFPRCVPSGQTGCKPVIVPARRSFPSERAGVGTSRRALSHHRQLPQQRPSGVVCTARAGGRCGDTARKEAEYSHPIYIIADEPYRELVYDGVEVPFIPTIYADTLVCYSWSKSLSMPGERIGYVLVPDAAADSHELLCAIAGAARAHGHVCAPSLIQRVIAHCAHMRPDVAAYDRNQKTLYEALTSYGYSCVNPSGAFYMLVRAPGGNSQAFSDRAKLEENLLIVPGEGFGCPEYFRLSTCVSHDMILRSLPSFQRLIQST